MSGGTRHRGEPGRRCCELFKPLTKRTHDHALGSQAREGLSKLGTRDVMRGFGKATIPHRAPLVLEHRRRRSAAECKAGGHAAACAGHGLPQLRAMLSTSAAEHPWKLAVDETAERLQSETFSGGVWIS